MRLTYDVQVVEQYVGDAVLLALAVHYAQIDSDEGLLVRSGAGRAPARSGRPLVRLTVEDGARVAVHGDVLVAGEQQLEVRAGGLQGVHQ